jgi:20S proteasome alpha/beta subunit
MISPLKRKPWPWNTLPEPRPADWGIGMTVCIAGHNFKSKKLKEHDCIICVSDSMVSTLDMSADGIARKIQRITQAWNGMFAGQDMSYLTPIRQSVAKYLAEATHPAKVDVMVAAFTNAYKEQLKIKAETEVLGTLGYTLEDFKAKGLEQLGAETFGRMLYEIQQQTIDLTFLIAGYDGEDPHIFTVSSPGKVEHYSELGFWAIGSGQTHALGSLFNLNVPVRFLSRASALYRLCEAKFNAENALGVGENTVVSVVEPNKKQDMIFGAEALRPLWEKTRVLAVPSDAENVADKLLNAKPTDKVLSQVDSSQLENS